jgi:hypothetical protein
MNEKTLNPYESPEPILVERGHARFRLRAWFAVTLYLALLFDFVSVWSFGYHLFLVCFPYFLLMLAASVVTRRFASIGLDETGVAYKDLVQVVDLSWDRIVRVIHRPSKTVITTDAPLVQITISRRHEDYDVIVSRIAGLQPELGFELSDQIT